MRDFARRHEIAAYVMLAYGISWIVWAPAVLTGAGGMALVALGAFGPPIAAGLVIRWTGGSVRGWLRPLLRWRVPGWYWLFALGLPALLFAVVNLVLTLLGEPVELGRLASALPAYIATFVVVALVGGGQEESGWRGFLLDRLQARFSPLAATLLLGVIWGLWHLPIYGIGFVGPMMFVFFYTWLWNRTRSLLLCVVLHGSFTAALDNLFLVNDSLTVDLTILGTLVGGAVSIVLATRGRLGFDQPLVVERREPAPAEVSGVPA
ncbi:MAG TPA: type II CAAX endopeptidase family protein [Actinomycetota bacterium]